MVILKADYFNRNMYSSNPVKRMYAGKSMEALPLVGITSNSSCCPGVFSVSQKHANKTLNVVVVTGNGLLQLKFNRSEQVQQLSLLVTLHL